MRSPPAGPRGSGPHEPVTQLPFLLGESGMSSTRRSGGAARPSTGGRRAARTAVGWTRETAPTTVGEVRRPARTVGGKV
ncbi:MULTISPECIES: hypothetical protein [unclassified Streptomyces]|uniref:hypothetical protein n=1 Tax=unclassified Streptomyces TaxID=2593676 RepID=UPI00224D14F9|nr:MULTISPECIES: hypothetical protein [unclassified Streptomyces]MCX4987512.1 hypothetical protein [Streptomyces sp. NBC_00568]MCX5007355.1 hypothetical protein [Streptomyces sp. NBC_00638]